jgi:hypothetical protein
MARKEEAAGLKTRATEGHCPERYWPEGKNKMIKVKGRLLNIKIDGEIKRVDEENDALVEVSQGIDETDLQKAQAGDRFLVVIEKMFNGAILPNYSLGVYKVEKDITFEVAGQQYGIYRSKNSN